MLIIAALLSLAVQQRPDTLSLEQALTQAQAAAPRARIAAAAVAQAQGSLLTAGVISNPVLSFEHDNLAPTQKLVVSQKFDWLLRRGSDRARGSAAVDAARADSAQLMAELARDVRLAFYRAVAAREEFRVAEQQMAAMDSVALLAERRLTAGDISALERDQVLLEALRWRQTLSRSRETLRDAEIQFGSAIAHSGAAAPVARGALDADLNSGATLLNAESVGNADQLPIMRSALATVAGADAGLNAAGLARIPMPGLVAGREWGELDPDRRSVILGLSLPVPLWTQGGPAVAEARANLARTSALADAARLTVNARIASARAHLDESTSRARIARDSIVPMATRLRQSAVRLFDSGRTGVLSVFDAFRQEREAIQGALEDMRAFQEARANGLAILGRWR